MTSPIYFIERNIHGALVIYGLGGVKQYYGYTKKDAKKMYKKEYEQKWMKNRVQEGKQ